MNLLKTVRNTFIIKAVTPIAVSQGLNDACFGAHVAVIDRSKTIAQVGPVNVRFCVVLPIVKFNCIFVVGMIRGVFSDSEFFRGYSDVSTKPCQPWCHEGLGVFAYCL
jgi:hypothetical protein